MAALVKLVALAFLLVVPISATDYTVGDNSGWTLGVDYNDWMAGRTFQVGDRLVFTYGPTHTVDEVNQTSYTNCSSSSPLSTANDGNTTITLRTPGIHYFLCATPGHCQQGMKVEVPVMLFRIAPGVQPSGVSRISYSMSSLLLAVSSMVALALAC